ncbi:hypothetical protein HDU84_002701 [Entophlyctis sp. JEL0112]|nr:hypothetical protein HDU84_002701 [Entophlyctis sp. JEL0112]
MQRKLQHNARFWVVRYVSDAPFITSAVIIRAWIVLKQMQLCDSFQKHFEQPMDDSVRSTIVEFLTAPSFTGLHILTACVASIGFAFLACHFATRVAMGIAQPSALMPSSRSESEGEGEDSDDSVLDSAKVSPLSETSEGAGEWKMVLLVRTDLDMTKGKAAAQCCHATLASVRKIEKQDPKGLRKWEKDGQAKVTLKCPNEEEMYV